MQAVANAVKECFGWNEATAKPVNTYHTACIMVVYRGDESLYLAAFFLFFAFMCGYEEGSPIVWSVLEMSGC